MSSAFVPLLSTQAASNLWQVIEPVHTIRVREVRGVGDGPQICREELAGCAVYQSSNAVREVLGATLLGLLELPVGYGAIAVEEHIGGWALGQGVKLNVPSSF